MSALGSVYLPFLEKQLVSPFIDFDNDTLKVMLVTSGYTFSSAHEFRSEITNETSGTNYSAGGLLIQNVVTSTSPGATVTINADNTIWAGAPSAPFTFRSAIIYKDTGNPATDPVISYHEFAADITNSGVNVELAWSTNPIVAYNTITTATELNDLADISSSTPTDRNVLVANGTTFVSRPLVEADISDLAHTTDAADLTSGVLADARVQETNVTQHQAALSITESQISNLDHTDEAAIHDNVANEITAISAKATPVVGDYLILEDSEAGFVKKAATLGTLPFASEDAGASALTWTFDTAIDATNPGNQEFKFDNATFGSVTNIYINDTTISGADAGPIFGALQIGDKIYVQQSNDASKNGVFTVSAAATDNIAWWTIPVTSENSTTLPDAASVCGFTFMGLSAGTTDHTELSNIGTNTHAQIDTHIADGTVHFTQGSISITESQISDLGAYLENVVEDTTPQLGGQLDVNGNDIVSTAGADINIIPDTTGNILLGNTLHEGGQTYNDVSPTQVQIQHSVNISGSDPTGLANDATVYTMDIAWFSDQSGVGTDNITVTGSAAQTYDDLITEISADYSFGTVYISNQYLMLEGTDLYKNQQLPTQEVSNDTLSAALNNWANTSVRLADTGSFDYVLTYTHLDGSGIPGITLRENPNTTEYPLYVPEQDFSGTWDETNMPINFSSDYFDLNPTPNGSGIYCDNFNQVVLVESNTPALSAGDSGLFLYRSNGFVRYNTNATQSGNDWRYTTTIPDNMTGQVFHKFPTNGATANTVLRGDGTGAFSDQNSWGKIQPADIDVSGVPINYVLTTDGVGGISWDTVPVEVLLDTTPQLGGNLDVNGFSIVNDLAGKIVLDATDVEFTAGTGLIFTSGADTLTFGGGGSLWTLGTSGTGVADPSIRILNGSFGNGKCLKLELDQSEAANASLRFRLGTAPTTPEAGDVWMTSTGMFLYDGTDVVGPLIDTAGGGLTAIVQDVSPELGGNLDTLGNSIVNSTGTSTVTLGNYVFDANQTLGAGQNNYVLTYDNGTNTISLEPAGSFNLIDDTTPQLGGNLDTNSFQIGHASLLPLTIGGVPILELTATNVDVNANLRVEDAHLFQIFNTGNTASSYINRDTTLTNISTADGGPLNFQGFDDIRVISTVTSNYLSFDHDSTDAIISGVNTTDLNFTGFSGINLGNYSFDVDQTVGVGQDNYVLTYDNGTGLISLEPVGSTAINDLSDVVITGPLADNEVLAYDNIGGEWINQTAAEANLASASHTHDTSDITTGTFADARIAASNVTQHEGAIDHDALTNFVANEHIDWTGVGAGTIDPSNYVDNDTTDHTLLSNIGTNTHAQIDTHIADSTIHFTQAAISITESQISDLQSYLLNVVEDTSPQLGGGLDTNGFNITSAGGADVSISPSGTGNILLGTLTIDADQTVGVGQDNYVLTYDNLSGLVALEAIPAEVNDLTAAVTWANVPDANITQSSVTQHQAALSITESQISDLQSYLLNVADDLTPQLGGDLDVNNFDIITTAGTDINLLPSGTGDVRIGNFILDGDQVVGAGQDNYVMTYDHATLTVSLEANPGVTALQNVVEDLTPQLGGSLDLAGFDLQGRVTVIDSGTDDAQYVLPEYTVATVPSTPERGSFVYVSDGDTGGLAGLYCYDGVVWQPISFGLTSKWLQDVVEDTTPQLGGNLDVQANQINTSTVNGDIDIQPNGTGNVLLGNLEFNADTTVGATQDGYVLSYDNATGEVDLAAPSTVLIATGSATNVASLDFTDLVTDFGRYQLVIHNVTPATDGANLNMVVSTNNGVSYITTANYNWAMMYSRIRSTGGSASGNEGQWQDTSMRIMSDMGTGGGEDGSGIIDMFDPTSGSYFTRINTRMSQKSAQPETRTSSTGGEYSVITAVNAFRLIMSTGNISTIEYQLYGYRQ